MLWHMLKFAEDTYQIEVFPVKTGEGCTSSVCFIRLCISNYWWQITICLLEDYLKKHVWTSSETIWLWMMCSWWYWQSHYISDFQWCCKMEGQNSHIKRVPNRSSEHIAFDRTLYDWSLLHIYSYMRSLGYDSVKGFASGIRGNQKNRIRFAIPLQFSEGCLQKSKKRWSLKLFKLHGKVWRWRREGDGVQSCCQWVTAGSVNRDGLAL